MFQAAGTSMKILGVVSGQLCGTFSGDGGWELVEIIRLGNKLELTMKHTKVRDAQSHNCGGCCSQPRLGEWGCSVRASVACVTVPAGSANGC